jgi:hypothetical protein
VRYTNQADAQTLRRKAAGPAALMTRRRLQPYVPNRGAHLTGLGAASTIQTGLTTIKVASTGSAVGASVAGAIGAGATAGSVVPIIGTAIGAILGLVLSGVFNKQDQEVQNFNQAIAIAQAQGPEAVINIANKYLVLAGLFDLDPGQVGNNFSPYKKYGRLGEVNFTQDFAHLIYNAAQSGQITANDTPQTVFSRIVNPWIQSMGTWSPSMPNATMLQYLLMGMIAEYAGGLQTRWLARGGDYPFGNLPAFSLPQQSAPAQPAAVTPQLVQTPAPAPVSAVAYPVPSGYTYVGTNPQNGLTLLSSSAQGVFAYYDFNPATGSVVLSHYTPAPSQVQPVTGTSPGIAAASQGVITQDQLNAAVAAALQQGATASQASQAAVQYVTAAGVPYTPATQQAVAQSVSDQTGTPVSELISGVPNIALLVGGALLLVILLKKKGTAHGSLI